MIWAAFLLKKWGLNPNLCELFFCNFVVGCLRLSNTAGNTSREPPAIGLFNYASVKQNRQHSRQLERKLNGEKDAFLCSPTVRLNGNRAHVCIVFFYFQWTIGRVVFARGLGTAFVEPVFAGALWKHAERNRERWKCEFALTHRWKTKQGNCFKV